MSKYQLCNNTRFILQFYKTCRSSVFICDCKWKFLFNHDENAMIDADLTISTFIADRSDSDHMCDLGITGIRKYRKRFSLSVHPSVSLTSHIPPWWMDGFSSYWVQWSGTMCTADVFKIKFVSEPNLSNYGSFFITFECCAISEKNVVILLIFGTVIKYQALLMLVKYHLVLCQKLTEEWVDFIHI